MKNPIDSSNQKASAATLLKQQQLSMKLHAAPVSKDGSVPTNLGHRAINLAIITMTSREIAELVETSHDSVLKTIRSLVERGVVSGNETPYKHAQNAQTYPEFRLSYRDTMVVASGYSVELRARLIDRWQELEAGLVAAPIALSIPKTYAHALRLAAEQSEQIEVQTAQLANAAPKVAFVDAFVSCEGNKGFREVCKLLNANERLFSQWMDNAEITYRLGGERTAYQQHVNACRFVVKAGISGTGEAPGHIYNQLFFTPKGVHWIAGEWVKHQLQGVVA